jgi:hypothetical protein
MDEYKAQLLEALKGLPEKKIVRLIFKQHIVESINKDVIQIGELMTYIYWIIVGYY